MGAAGSLGLDPNHPIRLRTDLTLRHPSSDYLHWHRNA
jgi:hypothetical protein